MTEDIASGNLTVKRNNVQERETEQTGSSDSTSRTRWRLILGNEAKDADGDDLGGALSEELAEVDRILGYLFDREYESDGDTYRERTSEREGGRGGSAMTAPDWLGRVRKLFPRSTAEQLTRLALDRYRLTDLLADEKTLEAIQPDFNLLRALLSAKNLMPPHVLATARRLIRKVVAELTDKLRQQVRQRFTGAIDRSRPSRLAIAKNLDVKTTIRRNLKHFQPVEQQLLIERAYFHSRLHRHARWDILLVVDQSGSMIDSVIHSAVLAAIFRALPTLSCRFILFDTTIVDLTEEADDAVEILMQAQLGGGTDIAQALAYVEPFIRNPAQTLLILITDFYEGGSEQELYRLSAKFVESGVTMLGLAALDDRAEPAFHHAVAQRLADIGVHIGAMTPDRLAHWVADKVRS